MKGDKQDADQEPNFTSIGSDDPPPPLGVENVKIQEISEKNQGTRNSPQGPLKIQNIDKLTLEESALGWVRID